MNLVNLYKYEEPDHPLVFEIGKFYRHATGAKLSIIGEAQTTIYGHALIGEDEQGRLSAIGKGPDHAVNWVEITREEWMESFS